MITHLNFIAGPKWDVTKELTDIKVASEGRETYHVRLRDFSVSTVLKPFLIALTLMFFFQMTGINVILQYTVDIFKSADSSVEKFQVKTAFAPFSLFRFSKGKALHSLLIRKGMFSQIIEIYGFIFWVKKK